MTVLIKRFIKTAAVFILAALTAAPALFAGTSFTARADDVKTGIVQTGGSTLNVRSAPQGTWLASLSDGTEVKIISQENDSSGAVWYKINSPVNGYVHSAYIEIQTEYVYSSDFETEIAAFPESYKEGLRKIHAQYPNYRFQMDLIADTFESVVYYEEKEGKKVDMSQYNSWKAMLAKNYNWDSGTWIASEGHFTYASREVIEYHMDPRNFLNTTNMFMFVKQSYSEDQTYEGVKSLISNSFMASNYEVNPNDENDVRLGGDYAAVILEAGKISGVNPYVLAAIIIGEQGYSGTSGLISGKYSGYEGYYNFFNIGATSSSGSQNAVIVNGLNYAKNKGWDSVYKSITGGAGFYSSGYLNNNQDTYYYKDYNVLNGINNYWHQYSTSALGPFNAGNILARYLAGDKNASYTLRIPVYKDMPDEPVKMPEKSGNLNNYYILALQMDGLNEEFDRYTFSYSANISSDTDIRIKMPDGAEYVGEKSFSLSAGYNNLALTVKSQTGYTRTYTIALTCTKPCRVQVLEDLYTDTVQQINGVWTYFNSAGSTDYSYTGFVFNQNGAWYVENGIVTLAANGIKYGELGGESAWWYVKNSKAELGYAGFADGENGRWRIENGRVDFSYNDIVYESGQWRYYDGGKFRKDYTGVTNCCNINGWWYVRGGVVDFSANTVAGNTNGWWKVTNGKVDFDFTGLASNSNGWWYLEKGKVNFSANTVASNSNGWWKVTNGKADFGYTGYADNSNGRWRIEGGRVNFNYNDIVYESGEWRYYYNGMFQKSYTGVTDCANENGWWYVKDGVVDFTADTVAMNKNGWWKVTNGRVDFDFTGTASNQNGSWYIVKGRVDFGFSGQTESGGITYNVEGGRVVS